MGSIAKITNDTLFVVLSLIGQICGGIGTGVCGTVIMSVVSMVENEKREVYIGYLEAACGSGFIIGPAGGAILYSLGGYSAPFYTFGAA